MRGCVLFPVRRVSRQSVRLSSSDPIRRIAGDRGRPTPFFFSERRDPSPENCDGIAILHYNLSYIRLDASLNFLFYTLVTQTEFCKYASPRPPSSPPSQYGW